jgi:chromosome segregation ATPase
MNLEIEAFRKKQKEGKNIMTLKGLSNKANSLPLEHLLEAKDKFTGMQRRQKETIGKRENEILRLEQDQFEIKTSNEVLETKKNDLENEIKEFRDSQSKTIKELGIQLDNLKRNNYEIFLKIKKINIAREDSKKTNEKIVSEEVVKAASEQIRQEILNSEFERLKKDIENKDELLMELNEKKKELQEIIATDENLIEAEENQKALNKKLQEKEEELDFLNYECFKLNHLQRLAIEQKESQTSERKNTLEELERLRGISFLK